MNMGKKYMLFGTDIYEKNCEVDLDVLMTKCLQHQSSQPGINFSNRGGGYQGQQFKDQEFHDFVLSNFPTNPKQTLPAIDVQAWVNINGHGAWNALHNHLDTNTILSGVFYVKVPPDSGNIFFYDPRFLSSVGAHYHYYYPDDGGYLEVTPAPNMLLFFPPSLFHMVGPNLTHDTRCSIAFNIMVASNTDIK